MHKPATSNEAAAPNLITAGGQIVKVSHAVINGISLINLDGFAPASQWEELSAAPVSGASRSNTAEASQ